MRDIDQKYKNDNSMGFGRGIRRKYTRYYNKSYKQDNY